jgi:hypothetical protein
MTRRGHWVLGVAAGLSVACAGKLNVHGDELARAGGSEGGGAEQVADGAGGRDDGSGQGGSREQKAVAGAGNGRAIPEVVADGGTAGTDRDVAVPSGGTSVSAGGLGGAGGAEWDPRECGERSIVDCEVDERCRLRRLRPLNVDDECLEAPASAECVGAHVPCPIGPVGCLRDANDRTWFGTDCSQALSFARSGDPCLSVLTGTGGFGASVPDCPGAIREVERECSAMTAEAQSLLDEVIPYLPRACEKDDDCGRDEFHIGCFDFCTSTSTLHVDPDDAFRVMEPVYQPCWDSAMLGCEPNPQCDLESFTQACIDGLCTLLPIAK